MEDKPHLEEPKPWSKVPQCIVPILGGQSVQPCDCWKHTGGQCRKIDGHRPRYVFKEGNA